MNSPRRIPADKDFRIIKKKPLSFCVSASNADNQTTYHYCIARWIAGKGAGAGVLGLGIDAALPERWPQSTDMDL